jgi:hypothetical protein
MVGNAIITSTAGRRHSIESIVEQFSFAQSENETKVAVTFRFSSFLTHCDWSDIYCLNEGKDWMAGVPWHRPRTGSVFTIARQKSQNQLLGLGWDLVGRGGM